MSLMVAKVADLRIKYTNLTYLPVALAMRVIFHLPPLKPNGEANVIHLWLQKLKLTEQISCIYQS